MQFGTGIRRACGAAVTLALVLLAAASARAQTVIDNAALANETDGTNWPEYGRLFDEQRYSPLDQINRTNVKRLGLVWSLDLPDVWNVSSAPVEVDGVIYLAVGFSVVKAVDAATGKLLWSYDPHCAPAKMRLAWGIRGLAFWKGRLYVGVQDGRLLALDAKSGQLLWQTQTTEPGDHRYITGAPRVFETHSGPKVLIGHGGGDYPHVRGYVSAYDADDGHLDWRFYTVPGNPADGFENPALAMAAKTWTGEWWKYGGGAAAWNALTYDPAFNRVYIGTDNGLPWNRKLRSPGGGDNLFVSSIIALDADTGRYVWHYQTTPGETWDYSSAMDMVLIDAPLDGQPRKLLLQAPKNGFFYVIDRATGKLLSAEKFTKVTWADHVDLKTGRPVEYPGVRYEHGEALIWPGAGGGHNWQPMAYSPATGLAYVPVQVLPGYYDDRGYTPATWSMDRDGPLGIHAFFDDIPKNAGHSSLLAWDPLKQRKVWEVPTPGISDGGLMATAGGLVFQGQIDGKFLAHDAATGETLWTYDLGVGTQAPPITYQVDGKQYVSILAGWAGGPMLMGSASAQFGWVGRGHPRRLLTFALDGDARLPPTPPPALPQPLDDPVFKVDPALAARGQRIYAQYCTICHGVAVVAGGYAPDLRASGVPLDHAAFAAIVRDGGLLARGMPPFPEFSDQDLSALQHYIRERARTKPSVWAQLESAVHFLWVLLKMKLAQWFG